MYWYYGCIFLENVISFCFALLYFVSELEMFGDGLVNDNYLFLVLLWHRILICSKPVLCKKIGYRISLTLRRWLREINAGTDNNALSLKWSPSKHLTLSQTQHSISFSLPFSDSIYPLISQYFPDATSETNLCLVTSYKQEALPDVKRFEVEWLYWAK